MGIDLKVMTSHFRERRGELLPTATLRFERDPELFSKFSKDAVPCIVHSLPSDLKVGSYEDEGIIFTQTDRYGQPLTWISHPDLAEIELPNVVSDWNRAVLAFLMALPEDVRIVLYWC